MRKVIRFIYDIGQIIRLPNVETTDIRFSNDMPPGISLTTQGVIRLP